MQALKDDIKKYPDSYHSQRAQRFNVSKTGIWWPLQRLKMSYKKTLHHPKAKQETRPIQKKDYIL